MLKHPISIQQNNNNDYVITLADCVKNINSFCLNAKELSTDNIKKSVTSFLYDLKLFKIANFHDDINNFTGEEFIPVKSYIQFVKLLTDSNQLKILNTNQKINEFINKYSPVLTNEIIAELYRQMDLHKQQNIKQKPTKADTTGDLFSKNTTPTQTSQTITWDDIRTGKAMFDLQIQPDEIEQDRYYIQDYNGGQVRIKVDKVTHEVWISSADLLGRHINSGGNYKKLLYIKKDLQSKEKASKFCITRLQGGNQPISLFSIKDVNIILTDFGKQSANNYEKKIDCFLNSPCTPKRVINKFNWMPYHFKIINKQIKISALWIIRNLFCYSNTFYFYKFYDFVKHYFNIDISDENITNFYLNIPFDEFVRARIHGSHFKNRNDLYETVKKMAIELDEFKKANQHLLVEPNEVAENHKIVDYKKNVGLNAREIEELKREIHNLCSKQQPTQPPQVKPFEITEPVMITPASVKKLNAKEFLFKHRYNFLAFFLATACLVVFLLFNNNNL